MERQESAAEWAKLMVELEAGLNLLASEKTRLQEQVTEAQGEEGRMKEKYFKLKGKHVAMKEKFDSEEMKWKEERENNMDKYWRLDLEKKMLEIDLKTATSQQEDSRITEIQDLEREKEQLVAEVSKLQKEKSDEAERRFSVEKALEAEKKRLEEVEAKYYELMKSVGVVERAANAIEDGVSKFNRESEEFKKILKEKMAAEAENRVFEEESKEYAAVLIKRNKALEKENKELEEKLSRANMEKDAEIGRLFKKRRALKENKTTEAQRKEFQPNNTSFVLKSEEDAEIAYGAHPLSNVVGILGTPAAQNQGIIDIED